MAEDREEFKTREKERKESEGSTGSRYWNLVLEGAQRDIQTETGYAEERIALLLRHRQIELDPNFWSLDDDIVNILKNGSPEEIQNETERMEKWIVEFKTKLSKANKMIRFMYSNQAMFHCATDAFARLLSIPDEDGLTDRIQKLVASICSQLLQLEETTTTNVELEMKLTSLDDHIHNLQVRMKEISKPNELANAQPRLEAVELQNCMLNELLNKIILDVQETSNGMKTLECGEAQDVRTAIREGLILSFGALDDCFPNLNAPRNSLSKYLWLPHDISIGKMTLGQLMQQFEVVDKLDVNMIQGLRHLKRSVKDLEETHAKVREVKKKVLWNDKRKTADYSVILRYSIPKRLENHTGESIHFVIERDGLNPVNAPSIDEEEELGNATPKQENK